MLKMRRTDDNCYSDDDDSEDDHNTDKHNPGDQGHWCHVTRLQNVRIVLRIIRGIIIKPRLQQLNITAVGRGVHFIEDSD